jgi:hypothetical protein
MFIVATGAQDAVGHVYDFLFGMGFHPPLWLTVSRGTVWPQLVRSAVFSASGALLAWGVWPERRTKPHSRLGHLVRAGFSGVLVFLASWFLLARSAPATPPEPMTGTAPVLKQSKAATPASNPAATKEGSRIELSPLPPIQNIDGSHGFIIQLNNRSDSVVYSAHTITIKAVHPGDYIDYEDQMDHLERQMFPDIRQIIIGNRKLPDEHDANSVVGIFNPNATLNQEYMNDYLNKKMIIIIEALIVYTYKSESGNNDLYYGELMAIMDPSSGGYQLIPGLNFNKHRVTSDKLSLNPK